LLVLPSIPWWLEGWVSACAQELKALTPTGENHIIIDAVIG